MTKKKNVTPNCPRLRFPGFTDPWEQCKWIDTVDISRDMVDPKTGKYDDLPHVAPGNIESFTGRIYDNVKLVKDENLISGKFRFHANDIIYGKINPQLGKYVFARFEGLTSADAYVLNSKNGLDQQYLYSIIQTKDFYDYSVSVSKRSGMPKINRDELNAYSFFAPSGLEQHKIGALLLSFDDLITLHQRKCDELKKLKKSFLQKMFPKQGELFPELRFPGFTDPWEQRKLGQLAEIVGGGTPDTTVKEYWNGDINWYAPAEIGDKIFLESSQRKITPLGLQKSSARLLPPGTVLFTSRAGIGNTAILQTEATTNQGFQSIVPHQNELNTYFIYSCTTHLKRYAETVAGGSTFLEISKKMMEKIPLFVPVIEEQKKVGVFYKKLDDLITLHQRKLETIKKLKKGLMQQMFI